MNEDGTEIEIQTYIFWFTNTISIIVLTGELQSFSVQAIPFVHFELKKNRHPEEFKITADAALKDHEVQPPRQEHLKQQSQSA